MTEYTTSGIHAQPDASADWQVGLRKNRRDKSNAIACMCTHEERMNRRMNACPSFYMHEEKDENTVQDGYCIPYQCMQVEPQFVAQRMSAPSRADTERQGGRIGSLNQREYVCAMERAIEIESVEASKTSWACAHCGSRQCSDRSTGPNSLICSTADF